MSRSAIATERNLFFYFFFIANNTERFEEVPLNFFQHMVVPALVGKIGNKAFDFQKSTPSTMVHLLLMPPLLYSMML
jgi:hypothetical protein